MLLSSTTFLRWFLELNSRFGGEVEGDSWKEFSDDHLCLCGIILQRHSRLLPRPLVEGRFKRGAKVSGGHLLDCKITLPSAKVDDSASGPG